MNNVVKTDIFIRQIISNTRRMLVVVAAQCTLTYIKVYQYHALIGNSKAHSQITRNERLSCTFRKRSKGDYLHRLVFLRHESHVSTQNTETLRKHAVLFIYGNASLRCILVLRNLSKERNANHTLQVFAATYSCIKEQYHKEYCARHCQTNKKTEQQDTLTYWRDRSCRSVYAIYGPCIVIYHSLRERILFTTIEQEHIKRLLDFLLSLYRKHLSFFGRYGSKSLLRLLLTAAGIVALHVDTYYHIIYRTDDRLLQGVDRIIQFLHYRVILATVGNQFIALQFQRVVLVNLSLYRSIADTRARRNKVATLCRVCKILLDKLRQLQLSFLLHSIGTVSLRLAHVLSSQRADIHKLITLLKRFEFGFYTTKLSLDDNQSLVDELRSIYCHQVLIVHRLLIIYIYKSVQHILGTQWRVVFQ